MEEHNSEIRSWSTRRALGVASPENDQQHYCWSRLKAINHVEAKWHSLRMKRSHELNKECSNLFLSLLLHSSSFSRDTDEYAKWLMMFFRINLFQIPTMANQENDEVTLPKVG
ncbi:hypothetical protein Adt_00532 [Abeliophyllum distichum]|uniref:Uncharacterized protein n=1 Tax=Abeliophyllum distichum TaxID=126358 RepID=A0ABD1VQC4_9LAMI